MKVHILFSFTEGPLGGGNQFLKALRGHFERAGIYAPEAAAADVIVFNSFHNASDVVQARHSYPEKAFVHRVDGAGSIYMNTLDSRDWIVAMVNGACADATIFQSQWSRGCVFPASRTPSPIETVIINAPDPGIFNRVGKRPFMESGKLRLLAASWSTNWEKGFDVYQWLDQNLDFGRIEMTFAGRSPVKFQNIRSVRAMGSRELADVMHQTDIFITGSRHETCPNVVLEALHCGVPVIALGSGAHEEILEDCGHIYHNVYEIPALIDQVVARYSACQDAIRVPAMGEVGRAYAEFCSAALKVATRKRISSTDMVRLGWGMQGAWTAEKGLYYGRRFIQGKSGKPV